MRDARAIGPRELLVADLWAYGLDTITGINRGEDVISRGATVGAWVAGRRQSVGAFVGFDEASVVLWVSWHFDHTEPTEEDAERYRVACEAFDALQAQYAKAAA